MSRVARLAIVASVAVLAACDSPTSDEFPEGLPTPAGHGIDRALYDSLSFDALTRFDDVPYESRLVSSFDRASTVRNGPGWFANRDWTGRVGPDPDGAVLFDEVGPGVITRFWSANPSGRVRFYFDGESTPRWNVDLADFLQGRTDLARPPFAEVVAGSSTSLWPIPFTGRLRITSNVPTFYYQIDFRRFASGTDIGTAIDEPDYVGPEREAFVALTKGARPTTPSTRTIGATLAPNGAPLTIAADPLGSELTELAVRITAPDSASLEQTILRIAFDGERTVFVPIARFFLLDSEGSDIRSLPIEVDQDSLESTVRFRMPFAADATIDLVAPAGTDLAAEFSVAIQPRTVAPDELRFHATWTGPFVTDAASPVDIRFVRIEGRGRYVGTNLRFGNPSRLGWWGEGDEKIWIDDDAFPARFGTGTEDYYGYSFCTSERFSTPWFGQFRSNREDFAGVIELYRFHFADSMPFDTSFEFVQEVRHWHADAGLHETLDIDGVSYFYASPGAVITAPWDEAIPHAEMQLPAEALIPMGSGTASCR